MPNLDKKHEIPKCKECKLAMEQQGTFRIGTFQGGIALYECQECKEIKEVKIKPTKYAKKRYKKVLKDLKVYRNK